MIVSCVSYVFFMLWILKQADYPVDESDGLFLTNFV
jgi:hypothetical protein